MLLHIQFDSTLGDTLLAESTNVVEVGDGTASGPDSDG